MPRQKIQVSERTASPEIFTTWMLAEYLRCHTSTIYRMLKEHRLPAFRVGSDWRFSKSAIDKWLKEMSVDYRV
jgi:excisionase family DNA binding protein